MDKDKKGTDWKKGLKDALIDAALHGAGEALKTAGERVQDLGRKPEPCDDGEDPEEEREEEG